MKYTEVVVLILRIILYPALLILRLILYIAHWLVSPFLWFGRIVSAIVSLPLRILAQFEALWYFLGFAIVIGTSTGCLLFIIYKVVVLVFDLDRKPVPQPIPATGHDAVSYRAAREEKKTRQRMKEERRALRTQLLASQPLIQEVVREAKARPINLSSPLNPNTSTVATKSGLFQDIILEQTDEDTESSFGA